MAANFESLWIALRGKLHPPQKIRNWTVLKGYLGDVMTVVSVSHNEIDVETHGAKMIQKVPKQDFEDVWHVWEKYKSGNFLRKDLREVTRYSKYVISILNWFETGI